MASELQRAKAMTHGNKPKQAKHHLQDRRGGSYVFMDRWWGRGGSMMVGDRWWGRHGPDDGAIEIKFRWSASLSLTVRSGVGAGVGCDETCFWCDLLAVSLSLSSIFLGWKSFEGKIKPKNEFWVRQGILQSTRKMNSVWPNFLELPNTHVYEKAFPEIVWSQNKRSLKYREYACLRIHYFVKISLKYRGPTQQFWGPLAKILSVIFFLYLNINQIICIEFSLFKIYFSCFLRCKITN